MPKKTTYGRRIILTGGMEFEVTARHQEWLDALASLLPVSGDTKAYLLRNGERAVILRALRMYMAQYQRIVGEERDPKHKEDLRGYIRAAEEVFDKLQPGEGQKQANGT